MEGMNQGPNQGIALNIFLKGLKETTNTTSVVVVTVPAEMQTVDLLNTN
jgi:hypothetical protein